MLAIEPFRVGRVYYWAIEDILRHASCDMEGRYYCEICRTHRYDYPDNPCHHWTRCEVNALLWDEVIERKSNDYQYDSLLESIRKNGFLRPLHAEKFYDEPLEFGNGHHRLVAAMELGYKCVPVIINTDSWHLDTRDKWGDSGRSADQVHPLDGVDEKILSWSKTREPVYA